MEFNSDVGIWPFSGTLDELLNSRRCVIVETYPAEACLHLGLTSPGSGWSKRKPNDRQSKAPSLFMWAEQRKVKLVPTLEAAISGGFGVDADGEDRFDAVVGLMSMIDVVRGNRSDGAPMSKEVSEIEGWIFGQT